MFDELELNFAGRFYNLLSPLNILVQQLFQIFGLAEKFEENITVYALTVFLKLT
jgi:hypothetical protein